MGTPRSESSIVSSVVSPVYRVLVLSRASMEAVLPSALNSEL